MRSATLAIFLEDACTVVSIHALLAECDRSRLSRRSGHRCFNPRTPCGVRRHQRPSVWRPDRFNPRTPCGVRQLPLDILYSDGKFQSTHSLRSATRTRMPETRLSRFQSTHSLRSATHLGLLDTIKSAVSIHALLAECDLNGPVKAVTLFGFNPRTPCGVRLRLTIYIVIQQRKRYFAPTSRRRPSSPSLLF